MTAYFCQKCNASIRPDDQTCPNCGADLSQVGRRIEVVMNESVSISDEFIGKVTPEERNFLVKFYEWLRENWTIDQVELGFPSGVKFTFKRRR